VNSRMQLETLRALIIDALEERKAVDLTILDVTGVASFTDLMIIASGQSNRQVKALADNVVEKAQESNIRPIGIEGEQSAEWILVDFGDVVVHVMSPEQRSFYNLEKLWSVGADIRPGSAALH